MIRAIPPGFQCLALVCVVALAASAPVRTAAAASKSASHSSGAKKASEHAEAQKAGKPMLVASYGDWGAYAAKTGSSKTCYALAQPKDREPSDLKRDPAYIFIAERPAENVRDEVSIIMGFDVKSGGEEKVASGKGAGAAPEAAAEIGSEKFALVAKGSNLWLENLAKQAPMIAAMRKASKLVVRAASLRGHLTTDAYSLLGFSQALDRVHKECR